MEGRRQKLGRKKGREGGREGGRKGGRKEGRKEDQGIFTAVVKEGQAGRTGGLMTKD